MTEKNEFILEVKSERHFKRAKFKFKFCELLFDLSSEITEAYGGID